MISVTTSPFTGTLYGLVVVLLMFPGATRNSFTILGGVDGWISPKFNSANRPAPDNTYAFQSLALNLRGHKQNAANGNNAVVINSEFRLPVFTTFFNRPVNNAFLRNFQIIQFTDLGTAWNGQFKTIDRPDVIYGNPPVQVRIKTGGIGPFIGGYGFGARSTLTGLFSAGWMPDGQWMVSLRAIPNGISPWALIFKSAEQKFKICYI